MDKKQFLDKYHELQTPAKAELREVLRLWLVEAKSDLEIAKDLGKKAHTTGGRKIVEICKHFGTDVWGEGDQRRQLVLLFRQHCSDFEVHPSIYPDWVDGDLRDRTPNPTNQIALKDIQESRLLGRNDDLIELEKLRHKYKIVLIKEDAGMGKTLLAEHFMNIYFHSQKVIPIKMGLSSSEVTPATEKLSTILSQLGIERSSYFETNLEALKKALSDRSNPVGVLIDNLEPALDKDFRFRDSNYDCLLRVLCDRNVCSFTLITSRISLSVQGINHQQFYEYKLKGLGLAAWQEYFRDCKNAEASEALGQMRNFYAGNPEAMAKLEGIISDRDNFDGDIEAYWKKYEHTSLANPDLKHLTSVQIDYLQNHQPDVYKLLCRMGCYRYQAVPTIPHEGLICLMWDVLECQHNAIVERLKKYSLIKLTKGEYYLHPATREAAKERLEENRSDWEIANRKAAEFWTVNVKSIETINDGLRAFEAYYHAIEVSDINLAAQVIAKKRNNSLAQNTPLGKSFYRLGLLEIGIRSIKSIIEKQIEPHLLCLILNILGDLYWLSGKVRKALECHNISKELAVKHEMLLQKKLAYFNMALCYFDLWEIDSCITLCQNALCIKIDREEDLLGTHTCSSLLLAWAYSSQDIQKIDAAEIIVQETLKIFSKVCFLEWGRCYSLYFLGGYFFNKIDLISASRTYNQMLVIARESNYKQAQAKALIGIGMIERKQNQFPESLSNILKSVDLFVELSAQLDLAEAYFQLGLTYQAMGEYDRAEEYRAEALKLFEEMEAPKQIERVNKAFGENIQ